VARAGDPVLDARLVADGLWVRPRRPDAAPHELEVSVDGRRWWHLLSVLVAAEPAGGPRIPGARADLLIELVESPFGSLGLSLTARDGRHVVGAPLLDEPPARLRAAWADWLRVLAAEMCPRQLLARAEVTSADLPQLSTAMGALADPERVAVVGPVVPVLHRLAGWRHPGGTHPPDSQEE
jgi:hypothetical protein